MSPTPTVDSLDVPHIKRDFDEHGSGTVLATCRSQCDQVLVQLMAGVTAKLTRYDSTALIHKPQLLFHFSTQNLAVFKEPTSFHWPLKTRGVWLMTRRKKRFVFRFKIDEKVMLNFCGEQYWCVVYCHLYDIQYGEYTGTTVVSVTSTYIHTVKVYIYSSQYRLWRQVMNGWMFIIYCLTFHNWIGDATPLPWQIL